MTRHTIIPTRSFLKVLATRSGDTTIKSIKAPGNSNQSAETIRKSYYVYIQYFLICFIFIFIKDESNQQWMNLSGS